MDPTLNIIKATRTSLNYETDEKDSSVKHIEDVIVVEASHLVDRLAERRYVLIGTIIKQSYVFPQTHQEG